jgi:hypothetical protein
LRAQIFYKVTEKLLDTHLLSKLVLNWRLRLF